MIVLCLSLSLPLSFIFSIVDKSKFQEIIKMLNSNEQQLKAEAQTYSASVASPDPYQSQGFSRQSERSRYTSSNVGNLSD